MKEKLKLFIKRLPHEVSQIFSIMMVVFLFTALINGAESFPIYRIAQLLGIAVLGGALILVAFSDIFLRKVSYLVRICIFIVPFFFVTLIAAIVFSWFTAPSLMTWLWFVGIFLICFAASVVIYLITTKIKGKAYTEKLVEYQNKKNDHIHMY